MAQSLQTQTARPGDAAPPFTLADADGREVTLEELLGKGPVVLFFVPHPPHGVCARTQCQLRDAYSELQALGATVVGVAPFGRRTLQRAIESQRLPYRMLSDKDKKVHAAYGVTSKWLLPARATFVLDKDGRIRWVERNPLLAGKHSKGALEAVREIAAE